MYSRVLPTDTPSPIFSEGRGRLYTGYLERIIPSSNCPSKLTDKVRRIVHSKLKLFHFQIKTYYLSDANHQTDNPSHTNNPSLVWNRPLVSPGHNQIWIYDDVTHICKMASTPRNTREGHFQALCCA